MSERFERENIEVLSPNGRQRREEILNEAVQAARLRRHRKILARAAAVTVGAIIFSWASLVAHKPASTPLVQVHLPAVQKSEPVKKALREIAIVQIKTDPSLLEELRVPPQKPTWKELSDDEFLKQLAAAGKPAGIAYVGGKPELLYR
jgi:hypothetical protein